jgi:hypothetical protein
MIDWSKHLKHENPDFSPTFQHVIKTLSEHFDGSQPRPLRCPQLYDIPGNVYSVVCQSVTR